MSTLSGEIQLAGNGPAHAIQGSGGILAIKAALDQLKEFRTFVKAELIEHLDYGLIPGTGAKPTLLQPGAQKIALYFNACPDFLVKSVELGDGHVEYVVTTRLIHRGTDRTIGQGLGSCTSMETRYRFRNAGRSCPECGADAIIAGKAEYGGGWLCFKKKGGCGAKFGADDRRIAGQAGGKVENENIHDVRNTVLKMAVKRSLVAASMMLGCASELFTQDLEDFPTLDLDADPTPHAPVSPPDRSPAGRPEPRRQRPDKPGGPAPAGQQSRAGEEPTGARRPVMAWDQVLRRALDRWHQSDPIPTDKERIARENRIANELITRGIAAELVREAAVCKPAEAGKPPTRDRNLVWDAVHWLWDNHPGWVKEALGAYLAAKREEAAAPAGPATPATIEPAPASEPPAGPEPGTIPEREREPGDDDDDDGELDEDDAEARWSTAAQ